MFCAPRASCTTFQGCHALAENNRVNFKQCKSSSSLLVLIAMLCSATLWFYNAAPWHKTSVISYWMVMCTPQLGDGLRYDEVEGVGIFPHFYGPDGTFTPLPLSAVEASAKIELENGQHKLPFDLANAASWSVISRMLYIVLLQFPLVLI